MIKSGPFNSINGDRKWSANDFASYFATFIGNGIFPNPSSNLQIVEGTNMQTIVKPGKGWINGYYVLNDSDYILQHDIADGVLKRVDRIVVRLNYLTREIEIAIKKGTFASNPVAPVLQRDTDAYELALADVLINNGVTVITQANITDQRLNGQLCGIVSQTVTTVDTTTLFNQYQSWIAQQKAAYETDFATWSENERVDFETWRTQQEQAFNTWMTIEQSDFNDWLATIQAALDGDTAGNLLNLINANTDLINGLAGEGRTTETIKENAYAIATLSQNLNTHQEDETNPHNVTKSQVGLSNVDNVKQIPLSEKGVADGVAKLDANGNVLKGDGTVLSGGVWEKIADITLISDTAQVNFTDLNTYRKFKLLISAKSATTASYIHLRINNITSAVYDHMTIFNNGAPSTSSAQDSARFSYMDGYTSRFNLVEAIIINNPTNDKSIIAKTVSFATGITNYDINASVKILEAINSLQLYQVNSNLFIKGSTFTLLGMK